MSSTPWYNFRRDLLRSPSTSALLTQTQDPHAKYGLTELRARSTKRHFGGGEGNLDLKKRTREGIMLDTGWVVFESEPDENLRSICCDEARKDCNCALFSWSRHLEEIENLSWLQHSVQIGKRLLR
ncbi:unnamed protein product [Toxocara canis]|uniref:Uncharacterized protein n=1 Tax=Toxocara canis TaxID=6265 RepID=A0A183ULW6_TOXCA|nr:unnamed protein product [Toxocara canis]